MLSRRNGMKRPFGMQDKIGYLLGDFGNDLMFQLASGYLLIFYTNVIGIEAAVVGTMFLCTRFFDAFTDIGMGYISDRMKGTRQGRFRPWIRKLSLPVVISSTLMYNIFICEWPYSMRILYMIVTYVLWGSILYTSINIPYGSMVSVITNVEEERALLSVYRTLGAILAGVFIGVIVPNFIYENSSVGVTVSGNRFMIFAVICSLIAYISYQLAYRLCIERVEIKGQTAVVYRVFYKEVIDLLKDKAFIVVILGSLLVMIAMIGNQVMNQYLFLEYFENTRMLPVLSLLMTMSMIMMAPFAKYFTKKIGKKIASAVSLGITGGIYIIIFLLRTRNVELYMALLFMANIGLAYYSLVGWTFVTDIIDNFHVREGVRKDGTVYAIYSFARKIGQALSGAIGGWTLAIIHYESMVPFQTQQVKNSIYNVTTLLPGVCILLASILFAFVYPLTKGKIEDNHRQLERRLRYEEKIIIR